MLSDQSYELYLIHEQIVKYLLKIKYFQSYDKHSKLPLPTYENLVNLISLHSKAISFGALDLIYYKEGDQIINTSLNALNNKNTRGISVKIEDIYNKLIVNNREGYCLEHNNLFLNVIQYLGYDAMLILTKGLDFNYFKTGNVELIGFQHVAIIVNLNDNLYLVDVGCPFQTPTIPVNLDEQEGVKSSNNLVHRIIKQKFREHGHTTSNIEPNTYTLQYKDKNFDKWIPLYYFNLMPCYPKDLEVINFYVMHHPDVIYNKHIILGKNIDCSRITIVDDSLNFYEDGNLINRIELNTEIERREAYKQYFDVCLSDDLIEHTPSNFGNFNLP